VDLQIRALNPEKFHMENFKSDHLDFTFNEYYLTLMNMLNYNNIPYEMVCID
jgi:hypothetical protein